MNQPTTHSFSGNRSTLLMLAALCLAWIVPGLIGHEPWKPDEAYSFGLVYHILRSGDWIVPTLGGEPFMEKPPLYYISAALFGKMFSPLLPPQDAARLATGFFMALTLLFTGITGRALWGKGHGRLTVLILIGCLGLLIRGHEMITDIALLTGFAVAIYGFALSRRSALLAGFWLGTGTGIGFMSKGLLAPGIIGMTALLLPILFRSWRSRSYASCLAVAFFAIMPWLVVWPTLLYLRSPDLFMKWFWINNLGRFFGFAHLGPGNGHWHYFEILPWFAWPALPIGLWTLWHGGRAGLKRPEIQLSLTLFLVMLAVLSAASDAREVYALPMLLPLSLLAAPGVASLRRGAASALNWFSIMTFGFFAGLFWFFWFALVSGHPAARAEHLRELQPGYTPTFEPLHFAIALLATIAWLIIVFRVKSLPRNPRTVINWAAGITLVWIMIMTLWLPWLDAGKSYRAMIASLQRSLPAQHKCISSSSLGEPQRALLEYYAGIVTRRTEVYEGIECDLLLAQGNANDPDTLPGPEWRKIWEGNRPGDKSERYRLFQRTP
ncbi:MAG TPA: glycosyltransferase family 39 protein [Sulfuricella sp.]|nr:glycosyltransferase family 39 protein [Sulfuricella sp.]